MTKLRVILAIIICFTQVFVCAQTVIDIGAIVETDSQLWTLKYICRYADSLAIDWEIKSKKANAHTVIESDDIYLVDDLTNKKYRPLKPNAKVSFYAPKPYFHDSLRIVFPAIRDTTSIISVRLSDSIRVDSIILPNLTIGRVKYKAPNIKTPLFTRIDSIAYSDSLFNKGMIFHNKKDYQEAIICFEKCYAFDRLLDFESLPFLFRSSRHYYDYSRVWLAHCYYKANMEEKAKALDEDYFLEPFDRKLVEKSDSLFNILNHYMYKPTSEEEHIQANKRMCEYDSIALGINHQRYALSLYHLGKTYSSYRHFAEAKNVLNRSYIIIENLSNKNWLTLSILDELAKIAYDEEEYVNAIHYKEQSMGITYGNFNYSQESVLSTNYATLANYYLKAGFWEKSIIIEKNKKQYWENQYKNDNNKWNELQLGTALRSYASILSSLGKHKEAFRIYNQYVEMSPQYKSRLMDLGLYYYNLRDYENAIKCYLESQKDSSLLKIEDLNILAIYYSALGDNNNAISLLKECIKKTNISDPSPTNNYNKYESYTTKLSNLAYFYNLTEQYDSALIYENKSLELKEKYFSPHSENIAYSYLNLGISYGGKGQLNKAIDYLQYSLDIYKDLIQRKYYQRSLIYLSKYSFRKGNYAALDRYVSELLQSLSEDLLSTFQELTYDERSKYIDEYSNLLTYQIPIYAFYTKSESLTSKAFDAALMIKGALLSSEIAVKRVIDDSKDASLNHLWEDLRAYRYILSKHIGKDSAYTKLNIDSLQRKISKLEDQLIVQCKEYGDITSSLKLRWQNVQKTLASDDIAIELLSFPIGNDSVIYAALTVRKNSKVPKMTVLFEEKQLKEVSDTLYYQCKEMYDLVWKPLQEELREIRNIYFSPSGALYNISIEHLPGMERYNIYRLSSTRELVAGENSEHRKSAVLYGGLNYYAQTDSTNTAKNLALIDETFKEHVDMRSLGVRGSKEYLKHTKVEVDRIGEELRKAEWVCLMDTAALGTEESFKALSGRRIGCLHISTHGFYYTKEEADNARYQFMLFNDNMVSAEDKALTRSGLLLSGANHVLERKAIPDNVEDGILTAKEIADVDLRGLDLVVLSACQTGLGDIAQGEGIFGLQRGFKKAGANSILMSLWKVDDKATQILMTQFYKNYASGKTKRQSLLSAQKYLKEYENGKYKEPKYWAAFILLDANEVNN